MKKLFLVLAVGLGLLPSPQVSAQPSAQSATPTQPEELVRFFPVEVNSLTIINVAKIMNSPRANREGWKKEERLEFLAGAIPVHPGMQRIVSAHEFVPGEAGQGMSYALIPTLKPVDMEKFTKNRSGQLAEVAEQKVCLMPNGTTVVPIAPQLLGVKTGQNMQEAGRWLKYAGQAGKSQQSLYLNQGLFGTAGVSDIVILMDLDGLISPSLAKNYVDHAKSIPADSDAATHIGQFFSNIYGIRFFATITESGIDTQFRLDSRVSLKGNPDLFKKFLIEFLDAKGAHLTDADAATIKVADKAVGINLKLSDEEIARIMSLFALPIGDIHQEDNIPIAPGTINAQATLRYFKAVNRELDQIRRQQLKDNQYDKTAIWHDASARKILGFSRLGVDPQMVRYGYGSADRLHSISESLRGIPILADQLDERAYYFTDVQPFWFGRRGGFNMGVNTNVPQLMQEMNEAIRKDEVNRKKIWDRMDKERAKVIGDMTSKYAIDFGR